MRAVIQRVASASVSVNSDTIDQLTIFMKIIVSFHNPDDTPADMEFIVRKILNVRLFGDGGTKRWHLSVKDAGLEVLCVSQFTLYCELQGNKPDYRKAMGGDAAEQFYTEFLNQMKKQYKPEMIKDGKFGATMQVNIQNDGPVTINIDSPMKKDKVDNTKKGTIEATEGT
ncbi:unnamed protein product, partial [Meganyctiphanes norvegica]